MPTRFDNKIHRSGTSRPKPTVRKVPADGVPYGESISQNGKHVWAAYDGERLIAVAATSAEVRVKYREALKALERKINEG